MRAAEALQAPLIRGEYGDKRSASTTRQSQSSARTWLTRAQPLIAVHEQVGFGCRVPQSRVLGAPRRFG